LDLSANCAGRKRAAKEQFGGPEYAGNGYTPRRNCHAASEYSDPARTNSYAARGHGYATNQPAAGIGRADGSPTERDDSGRNARIQPAANANSGQHYATINHIPEQPRNDSEWHTLCDARNAERLDAERRVSESRILESERIYSGLNALDAQPRK
jgi:hypothetical protein